jgi:UDP-GlcNAc:undecaprenyl-phosphate GlcNAc-1-phosphate transferase
MTLIALTIFISWLLYPLSVLWSKKLGLVDRPDARKQHARETPMSGGMLIYLSLGVICMLIPELRSFCVQNWPLAVGFTGMFLLGIFDDRLNLSARSRFAIQIGLATLVVISGTRIEVLYGVLGIEQIPPIAAMLFAVIVIAGLSNAYNLIDGMDGLLGIVLMLSAGILTILAFLSGQFHIMSLLLVLLASVLVFLRFNFYPARIFMGDSGSASLGFLLASLAIMLIRDLGVDNLRQGREFIFLVSSAFLLPVMDALRVFLGRIKLGRSPMKADRSHIHHLFHQLGWGARRTVMVIAIFQITSIAVSYFIFHSYGMSLAILTQILTYWLLSKVLHARISLKTWSTFVAGVEKASSRSEIL